MDLKERIESIKNYKLNNCSYSVYDYDEVTMQELLNKFFKKINDCITVSNETLDLVQWLVDVGLNIEVVKQLEIWLQDGTLAHIINEVLLKDLETKVNKNISDINVINNDIINIKEDVINNTKNIKTNTNILNKIINAKNYGCVSDGFTDDSENLKKAINDIKNGDTLVIPYNTLINSFIPIHDKGDISIKADKIIGNGKVHIQSSISNYISTQNIVNGSTSIPSDINVNIGDYIVVKGYITRGDYNVSRLTLSESIHKVVEKDSYNLILDEPIPFSLTNVTLAKILNPYKLKLDINSEGVGLDILYCSEGNIKTKQSKIYNNENAMNIVTSKLLNINSNITDSTSTLGLVCNNISNSYVNYTSLSVGNPNINIGSKAFRGNAIINSDINLICEKSFKGCSTIYGSKNSNINIISNYGGYINRLKNITSPNRLESVQFSECDNLKIKCNINDADDQAFELLACNSCFVEGIFSTLPNSSEGCIVIKGGSKNISLNNVIINSYNPYGVKIEGTDPDGVSSTTNLSTSNITINNLNMYAINDGLIIRDYNEETYSNIILSNSNIKGKNPIVLNINANSNTFKNNDISSLGGHCLLLLSEKNKIKNCNFNNTNGASIRAISSRGKSNSINNCCSDGGYIYLGGDASTYFNLKDYTNNMSDIFIDTFNSIITNKRGYWETVWIDATKGFGQCKKGDIIYRTDPFSGSSNISYWICKTDGIFVSDNFQPILHT